MIAIFWPESFTSNWANENSELGLISILLVKLSLDLWTRMPTAGTNASLILWSLTEMESSMLCISFNSSIMCQETHYSAVKFTKWSRNTKKKIFWCGAATEVKLP
jgi:hypothetical protein